MDATYFIVSVGILMSFGAVLGLLIKGAYRPNWSLFKCVIAGIVVVSILLILANIIKWNLNN